MGESGNVELLEWDTEFFGFPVAQIIQNRLDREGMARIDAFCRERQIRLLQFKCDAHHRPSVLMAEENGFHFADVRMLCQLQLKRESAARSKLPERLTFRLGNENDVPALHDIITDLYTHSRYYFDTNFPRDRVRVFYRDWIEKAVHGQFDDLAWVICDGSRPVGFCSARFGEGQCANLGLVGIDPRESGQGLGGWLLQEVLLSLADRGIERVTVVTQGRNYGAQRLYQRVGFLMYKIEIYYHRWFNNSGF